MLRGKSNIKWKKSIVIEEAGGDYPLHITLVKTRLVIKDEDGNRIAVDKRKGRILIERRGKVEWHREKNGK